jgi:hypothetical protein
MKIAVSGSRNYPHPSVVRDAVADYIVNGNCGTVVHGGAKGVDTIADSAARSLGCPTEVIRPNYAAFPGRERAAPLARNTRIIEEADVVLVFWDEESRGTADTIKKARAAAKPLLLWGASGKRISSQGGAEAFVLTGGVDARLEECEEVDLHRDLAITRVR